MDFKLVDKDKWARNIYFQHYFSDVPCTYSISVKLDITTLRKGEQKLYPAMLYCLTSIVNRHPEFRTAINDRGQLGIYDSMHPCYTIFHKDNQTFSNLWTEYNEDYAQFHFAYEKDRAHTHLIPSFLQNLICQRILSLYQCCLGLLLKDST